MIYKVKIFLTTPIAFQTKKKIQPIHFDGLLTALSVFKNGILDNPIPQNAVKVNLPLIQVGNEKKIWKASCMKIDPAKSKVYRDIWTGSTSWVDFVPFKGTLNPSSGIFRAKAGILMLLVTPYVEFYFDTENINKVIDLLNDLTHIGSRISAGYGEIKNIEIEKSKNDYTLIDEDGYIARHIPVTELQENADPRWNIDFVSYKPPYYFYPFFDMCYVPPIERYWPYKKSKDAIQQILNKINEKKAGVFK
ncbi:hypothetical protein V7D15_07360 [Thermoanaerobacter thermohydrosulfuricus]